MNSYHSDAGFPGVFVPEDLSRMSVATTGAVERLADDHVGIEMDAVARIVLQFYRRSLFEPKKLADVAVTAAHSKLFRRFC
tara:strand:- start:124 stop:366 length:243 start_codon:yes stop_codon:yes gene_type:complete